MRHTITLGNDGIVYVKIIGSGDVVVAREFVKAAQSLFDKYPDKKFEAVVDMLESGTSDYEGIKIYRDFLKSDRLGRVAFVIRDPIVTALVKTATEFKNDAGFFDSVENARLWLVNQH